MEHAERSIPRTTFDHKIKLTTMYNHDSSYRYRLETYKPDVKKHVCPACGKRSFVRYIDVETKEYVSTEVGRCDREEKCGYHKRPKDYFAEHGTPKGKDYYFPDKSLNRKADENSYSTIAKDLVKDTLRDYDRNNFIRFIAAHYGADKTAKVLQTYTIGTSRKWPGANIFWQIDSNGRARTGKIMLYDRENGHRVKQPYSKISWVHTLPYFHNYRLSQCLFGEHLLPGSDKPVGIVESEKTAVICSIMIPDAVWLATGGLCNLRCQSARALLRRKVILFPDLGAEQKWQDKARQIPELRDAVISSFMTRTSTPEQRQQGLDIGDYLLSLPAYRKFSIREFL